MLLDAGVPSQRFLLARFSARAELVHGGGSKLERALKGVMQESSLTHVMSNLCQLVPTVTATIRKPAACLSNVFRLSSEPSTGEAVTGPVIYCSLTWHLASVTMTYQQQHGPDSGGWQNFYRLTAQKHPGCSNFV
jgi:hypothetical protein